MNICYVSPRFFPVIGGTEIYFKNIIKYCSKFHKITVITSNLTSNIGIFEKQKFIPKQHDLIFNNTEILRGRALKNRIIRYLFYLNTYLNKKLEIYYDKKIHYNLYDNKPSSFFNSKLVNKLDKLLLLQRFFGMPNFLQIYYILNKLHKNNRINLIHSAPIYLTSNIYAYLFAKRKQIPYICTPFYHINPYADYIFYPTYQKIIKNSDAVIACTSIEKELYHKLGVKKEKIFIIPPGIELNNYEKPELEEFKKRNNIPQDSFLLLFMARRSNEKGFKQCISALNLLIKKYNNIYLMIAGSETKDYRLFYNKLPEDLKSHIIDLGIIVGKEKVNVLANCDVFILPSVDDAFGIVYLEAWLFKKPVIGALGGNVEGLIDNNINGYLIQFYDIKALASKIELLLINDQKRMELGQNGYKKLLQNYKIEDTNKKILNLYRNFI